ncbi:nucleoside/nucleotide kinase family protein [Tropicimonas sp.]|uniref:nucleoside/nucleotide kinase family protein n=1 Tax=Tropicimonas sp. TaxID=2067044 RepID=UPI003A864005
MREIGRAALAECLFREQGGTRRLVAIAGAPGSGKSTLADRLCGEINARRPGIAAVLPMDGYHFDDMVLEARGDRARKGAPFTFDVGGFRAMLARLRDEADRTVAVPVFDRSIEIARAGARLIGPEVRLILVEGNYLLLDRDLWRELGPFFDLTVFLDVPREVLHTRLRRRWERFGMPPETMRRQLEGNDFVNIETVLTESLPADLMVRAIGSGES